MWNTFPSSDSNKAPNYELAKKSAADAEQVVAQLSRATITYVSCAFIFCYSRLRHARITHALNFDSCALLPMPGSGEAGIFAVRSHMC